MFPLSIINSHNVPLQVVLSLYMYLYMIIIITVLSLYMYLYMIIIITVLSLYMYLYMIIIITVLSLYMYLYMIIIITVLSLYMYLYMIIIITVLSLYMYLYMIITALSIYVYLYMIITALSLYKPDKLQVAFYNEPFEFDFGYSSSIAPSSFSWTKNGQPFKELGPRVSVDHTGIIFTRVLHSDAGEYVVTARNEAGVASASATLQGKE